MVYVFQLTFQSLGINHFVQMKIIKKPLKANPQNTCNNINQLLILKSCLESVKPIVTALGIPKSALFLSIKEVIKRKIENYQLLVVFNAGSNRLWRTQSLVGHCIIHF
jgi:hypothetical protein